MDPPSNVAHRRSSRWDADEPRHRRPDGKHAQATSLVVVDANRPVRLITEADVVRAVADGKDVNDVRIEDVMTTSPTVIPTTTTIRDAARSMIAGHFRHLPVVDDAGLVGMVDIGDTCSALLYAPALASSPPSG
jgi:CBS domain-containing protein